MTHFGFTLIELLIVVAIIGILAAIAIPNFLNAQTRAKVACAKADMHTLKTGLEIFCTDRNIYPRGNFYQLSTRLNAQGADRGLILLSTPVSYVKEGLMLDPFDGTTRESGFATPDPEADDDPERIWYKYSACNYKGRIIGTVSTPDHDDPKVRVEWILLQSCGPDRTRHTLGDGALRSAPEHFQSTIYDPTNGTVSRGSIYSVAGSPSGVGGVVFRAVQQSGN